MSSKTSLKVYLLAVVILLISVGGNVKADFIFGTPAKLGPAVNSSAADGDISISDDGLELYFEGRRPGGYGGLGDLYVSTRETTTDPWSEAVILDPPISGPDWDGSPDISSDGLELYFTSDRSGSVDLWVATRVTKEDPWEEPVNLGSTVNSSVDDFGPSISSDGLSLYFGSPRSGGLGKIDLWVTTRAAKDTPWEEPVNLGSTVNSSLDEAMPDISSDGRVLFFSDFMLSQRDGGYGGQDLWMTTRASINDPWEEPINLGPQINSPSFDFSPNISADGSKFYFTSDRGGAQLFQVVDAWEASLEPIVDLNSDGIVDSTDMCIMVDHWGTDEPLCDIGPMPWGDGIVDVQDLIVLSEHLFKDVNDPTLIAHWALDETEGMIAHDSVNGNDDFVMGGALWQSNGGKVDGAIELDGVDDCVICKTGPNPAEGPCSILAWIKGGAPGQVIIAQPAVADFMAVDSEGNLMTGLNGSDQSSAPLLSQASVTDGQWHRIGLVWDGLRRSLFVDGVKVAEDIEDGQGVFGSGLYIGVGKDYVDGTFFSGLIDDVRIYKRAVKP